MFIIDESVNFDVDNCNITSAQADITSVCYCVVF